MRLNIFARDPRHGGEIGLSDLLTNDNPARSDILAELVGQFRAVSAQRRPRSGRKLSRRDHRVGFAQPRGKQRDQRFVNLRMGLGELLEGRPG